MEEQDLNPEIQQNEVITNQVIDADIQEMITGEKVRTITITPEMKNLSNIHIKYSNSISTLNFLEVTKQVLVNAVDQAITAGLIQPDSPIITTIQNELDDKSNKISENVEKITTLDDSEYNITKLLDGNQNNVDSDAIEAVSNLIDTIYDELKPLKTLFLDLIKKLGDEIGSPVSEETNRHAYIASDSIDAAHEFGSFGMDDEAQKAAELIKNNREAIYDTLDEAKKQSEEIRSEIDEAKALSDFELEKQKVEDLRILAESLKVLKSKIIGKDLDGGKALEEEIEDVIEFEELDDNGNIVENVETEEVEDNNWLDVEESFEDKESEEFATELNIVIKDYDELSDSDFKNMLFKKGVDYAQEYIFTLPKEKRTHYIGLIKSSIND